VNLTDAIEAHREHQYRQSAELYRATGRELSRERFFGDDTYHGGPGNQFDIAKEVGARVGRELGELVRYGLLDNGREHGLTYTTPGADGAANTGWTFCVYQHRSSDIICIDGCPTNRIQPHGPYGGDTSGSYLLAVAPMDYDSAAAAVIALLRAVPATDPGQLTREFLVSTATEAKDGAL